MHAGAGACLYGKLVSLAGLSCLMHTSQRSDRHICIYLAGSSERQRWNAFALGSSDFLECCKGSMQH